MNSLFQLLFLILAGNLECSSIFNFDMIENEIKSGSEGMPKITSSNVAANEISFGPEPLNKRSNDLAAATTDTAFGVIPAAHTPPVENLNRNSHFEPSFDENFLITTISDKSIPFWPLEAADNSSVTKASELTPRASPKNDDILRARDSFDHRSSSGRASPSNDLPLASPLPSSFPIPLPSNISGSLNNERVPKRAREETDAGFDKETQDSINEEVRSHRYKSPERCAVLRKAIELIAQNNYYEFIAYEPNFVAEFNCNYRKFKKKPRKAYYLIQYIIRFGATNFLQSNYFLKSQTEVDEISKFEAAFDHLIRTKPFEVAMQFIRTMRFMNNESLTKSISAAMEARYPNLHFLDFVVFEIDYSQIFSIKVCDFHKIIETRNEEEKLKHFTNFLMKLSKDLFIGGRGRAHYSYTRYLKAFFKYSEYFMSLKIDIREMFAKFAILNEDLDSLSKIIDMDPEIILYNQFDSLFAFAARSRCAKTFQFFMDIVPEHANLPSVDHSPIDWSIFTDSLNNIEAFSDCGFDFTQDIRHYGNFTTSIQLAFKSKSSNVFNFFINKFGPEFIMAQLLQVYGSEYEIIQQASSGLNRTDKFLCILKNRLGINFFILDRRIKL
jgi:hypothetical protein